jgi:hypothetical protein
VVLGSPSLSYIYAHILSPVLIASIGERHEAPAGAMIRLFYHYTPKHGMLKIN